MVASPDEVYVRLHITPFSPALLTAVLPPSLASTARNISYHTLDNFPESPFGYLELPTEGAERLKKKLHGTILKGAKMQVTNARPSKQVALDTNPRVEASTKRDEKGEKSSKKRKRKLEGEVLHGVEVQDRKIKRGWTDNAPSSRSDRDKRSKTKDEKRKEKERVKSKYTTGEECLFKTRVPPTNADLLKDKKDKKEKKERKAVGDQGRTVIHEFQGTVKHATFLKSAVPTGKGKNITFVQGQGWVDEDGTVVERDPQRSRPSLPLESQKMPATVPDESSTASSSSSETESEESIDEETTMEADLSMVNPTQEEVSSEAEETLIPVQHSDPQKEPASHETDDGESDSDSSSDSDSDSDSSSSDEEKPAVVFATDAITISTGEFSESDTSSSDEDVSVREGDSDSDEEDEEVVHISKVMTISEKSVDDQPRIESNDRNVRMGKDDQAITKSQDDDAEDDGTSDSSSSDSSTDSESESDESTPKPSISQASASLSGAPLQKLSISIPEVAPNTDVTAQEVHPLEAIYKRRQGENQVSAPAPSSFTFFGADDDIEDASDNDEVGERRSPMTPHNNTDMSYRNMRSAAPTPDTAHPSRLAQDYFDTEVQDLPLPPKLDLQPRPNSVKAVPAAKTFISGKLPPGSIDFSGKNTKKTFADENTLDSNSWQMGQQPVRARAPVRAVQQSEDLSRNYAHQTAGQSIHPERYVNHYEEEEQDSGYVQQYNPNEIPIKSRLGQRRDEPKSEAVENRFYAEERKDEPAEAKPETDGTDPNQDFSKWFYENRGDTDRAWKRRRKVVAKEGRQKSNRKRGEQRI